MIKEMTNLNLTKIEELANVVENAKTFNSDGRQSVAQSCKELYKTIEEWLYTKFGEVAISDAHEDLCNGNFAEPFMCEKKKEKFNLYKTIVLNSAK